MSRQSQSLDQYREALTEHMVQTCTGNGYLRGVFLNSPDIDNAWLQLMQPFCCDAVREFNNYPEYCLGCAGYLGMSVAGEAWHFLQKESPEPGTADAYRMFLITVEVMYKIGASIELQHLGYKFVKA